MRYDNEPADRANDELGLAGSPHLPDTSDDTDNSSAPGEEPLSEEISTLIEDASNYVQAEVAFQKTRAKFAGRSVASAAAFLIVAIITLHIAIMALAVGLVIALQPLVTIWGAIAIVVGVLLLVTILLALSAKRRADRLSVLFASEKDA